MEFLLGALHRVETDRPVGSTLTLPRGLHDLRGRLGPLRVSHGVGERACVVWAGGKEGVSGRYLGDLGLLASRSGRDRSGVRGRDGAVRPVCTVRTRLWTYSSRANPTVGGAMDDRRQSPSGAPRGEGVEIGGGVGKIDAPPKGMFRDRNWVHTAAPANPTRSPTPTAPPGRLDRGENLVNHFDTLLSCVRPNE